MRLSGQGEIVAELTPAGQQALIFPAKQRLADAVKRAARR